MITGFLAMFLLLTFVLQARSAGVEQSTSGWCSPAQNGNNNVVNCYGVDPRTMARLNDELDRMDLSLKQKTAEANTWAQKYYDLNTELDDSKKQLAVKGEDATLVQAAQDLLHEGKLDEARGIFNSLIESDEANVDRAAQDHFGRASVFALQFRMNDALPDFAWAYQYRPTSFRYADSYAFSLLQQKEYGSAEPLLLDTIAKRRALVAKSPAAYLPGLAATLNFLGNLYDGTDRFDDAETALKEAAEIWRELAGQNPATHRADLASTLNNLGSLYDDTHRFTGAETAYKDGADIWREVAAQNPAAYQSDLATTLNNLGNLYGDTHRFADAETAYKEAADIRGGLAAQNPAAYRPGLEQALSNLAILYRALHRDSDARSVEAEEATLKH